MKINSNPYFLKSIVDFQSQLTKIFVNEILNHLKDHSKVNIALSGGNTPQYLFEKLSKEYVKAVDWSLVNFFWVDERCVPEDNEMSNFGNAKKNLLLHLPKVVFHRMKGELEPEIAATEYQALLYKKLPIVNNFPQFDLVLLGMGEDGHTASIFPDTLAVNERNKSVTHVWLEEKKVFRISLTLPVINNARSKILAFYGENKCKIFNNLKNNHKQKLPIQMVDFTVNRNAVIIGD